MPPRTAIEPVRRKKRDSVMQDQVEAEFFGNADSCHQIVGTMAMKVNGALSLQDFNERLQAKIDIRRR
jgi:hypothetical protein